MHSYTVDLKPIKTAYSAAAGTALVTFENAVVPARYVMGKENEGLKASAMLLYKCSLS